MAEIKGKPWTPGAEMANDEPAELRAVMRDPDLAIFPLWDEDDEDRPDKYAGWDIDNWCRVSLNEDREHGLRFTVSTRAADYSRSVTREQVEEFAQNLLSLVGDVVPPRVEVKP